MIPKIIHYCWFGKKRKPKLIRDCIKTWKKYCADFEIIEWNEENTDLSLPFVQKAYKEKKWAFVSDYVRFKALYDHGGIYLDTDMLVVKPLNDLLQHEVFFGTEEYNIVSCGIIGSRKHNSFIKKCFMQYVNMNLTNINWIEIVITRITTDLLQSNYNFQESNEKKTYEDVTIYPTDFFYPLPFKNDDAINYKKYIKPETYAVHLWVGSWIVYNEFIFFRNGEYRKGVSAAFKNFSSDKLNFKYLKKIMSSIKQSFTKK